MLTQPDRPAGRGMKLNASAVKLLAQKYNLTLLQPRSLKQPEIQEQLSKICADIMVVAAYGLILPAIILNNPRFGCINIHASLLPHWRGAAPIQRAILAGERRNRYYHHADGPRSRYRQHVTATEVSLYYILTTLKLYAISLPSSVQNCVVETLNLLKNQKIVAIPQNEKDASYAPKLEKGEAKINWQLSAEKISYSIRAFNPHPGAHSTVDGFSLKIFQAKPTTNINAMGSPGEILSIWARRHCRCMW